VCLDSQAHQRIAKGSISTAQSHAKEHVIRDIFLRNNLIGGGLQVTIDMPDTSILLEVCKRIRKELFE